MLALILEGIFDLVDEAVKVIFTLFAGLINFNLSDFSRSIPAANTLYGILRALGLGLVIAIAVYQIAKYFVGPLAKTTEKPQVIMIRTFFAVFLIFFAPYILESIFSLTGIIYADISNIEIKSGVSYNSAIEDAAEAAAITFGTDLITWATGLGVIGMLFGIVLGIVLIVQFTKMMLEIVERYIFLVLIIYSSPLALSTFASESTSQILKKWISMFLSQCILMIMSVWGCVIFMSIVKNAGVYNLNIIQSMIYAYAIVKIIKRLDNYLQQLGLNPAITGGASLLDSIAATAGGLGRLGKQFSGTGRSTGAASAGGSSFWSDIKRNNCFMQGMANAKSLPSDATAKDRIGAFIEGSKRTGFSEFGRGIRAGASEVAAFAVGKGNANSMGEALTNAGKAYKNEHSGKRFNSFKEADATRKINESAQKVSAANQKLRENIAKEGGDPSKFPQQQQELGEAIGEMCRVAAGVKDMPNAIANSDMAEAISESVEGMPYVAYSALQDMAEKGGGEVLGDAATDMWRSFVGEDAWQQAGLDQYEVTDSQLTVSPNQGVGNAFDWSATIRDPDTGEVRQIEWSNMNGKCAPKVDKNGAPVANGSTRIQSAPGSVANAQNSQDTYMRYKSPAQNNSNHHSSNHSQAPSHVPAREPGPAPAHESTPSHKPAPTPESAPARKQPAPAPVREPAPTPEPVSAPARKSAPAPAPTREPTPAPAPVREPAPAPAPDRPKQPTTLAPAQGFQKNPSKTQGQRFIRKKK